MPLRPGLDDDVVELLCASEPSLSLDHQLKRHGRSRGDGRLAEPAGGNLDVLLADGLDHVAGGHAQGGEFLGIEPYTHAVVARAEERHVAHALDARQVVLHAERSVIAQVELIVVGASIRLLLGDQIDTEQDTRRLLLRGHADPFDVFGQLGLGHGNAVLYEHLRRIEVRPQLEGHVEEHLAVVRTARRHVQHPLHAVDFLLDRSGHGGGHRLRIGPGVDGRDLNRRRSDVGVLGNRQAG